MANLIPHKVLMDPTWYVIINLIIRINVGLSEIKMAIKQLS